MRRIIPLLLALSALVFLGCGDAPVGAAGNGASGGTAVGPEEGANAIAPNEGSLVSIVGGTSVGPQDPGAISLGSGTVSTACAKGDYVCLCYMIYDLTQSCGIQADEPRSWCETSDFRKELNCGDGISKEQCWAYFDALLGECINAGCACFEEDVYEDDWEEDSQPPQIGR